MLYNDYTDDPAEEHMHHDISNLTFAFSRVVALLMNFVHAVCLKFCRGMREAGIEDSLGREKILIPTNRRRNIAPSPALWPTPRFGVVTLSR
jgi:hypothetical protein